MNLSKIVCLFLPIAGNAFELSAQTYSGKIMDKTLLLPISGANVRSSSGKNFQTKEDGSFKIDASPSDTLYISYFGYEQNRLVVGKDNYLGLIYLNQKTLSLKEIKVESPLLKYRKDSLENRIIYGREIRDAQRKTKYFFKDGMITGEGFLSEIIVGLSGKKKRQKRFFEQLQQDEKSKFIALCYNTAIVKDITRLDDSTADLFILHNPMPYDFARSATPLEIHMWIREQSRNFLCR